MKYFTKVNGNWIAETIKTYPSSSSGSIALNSSDEVFILHNAWYSNYSDIKIAYKVAGSWQNDVVAGGDSYEDIHLVIDDNDFAHAQYTRIVYAAGYSFYHFIYLTNKSGSWVQTDLVFNGGNHGKNGSIDVDSNGMAHVSCYDREIGGLSYATNAGGAWVESIVDQGGKLYAPSLALGTGGSSYISVNNDTTDEILVFDNSAGSWNRRTVYVRPGSNYHPLNSLAVDDSDNVHVAFIHGTLLYASDSTGPWAVTVLENQSFPAYYYYPEVEVDSNGKVHIAYREDLRNSIGSLKHADNALGAWQTEYIDSLYRSILTPSMVIDQNDKVHISYGALDVGNMKYANNITNVWEKEDLAPISDGALYSSIGIDSSGTLHVLYAIPIPNADDSLIYATNRSGTWETRVIEDSVWDSVVPNSLFVDSNDAVHITYFPLNGEHLVYATNMSGDWVKAELDEVTSVNYFGSIRVTDAGQLRIAYKDNYALKHIELDL
jgi:hypothetical protein